MVPSLLCTDLNACPFPPHSFRWTGAVFIQLWGETEQMWDFLQGLLRQPLPLEAETVR